MFKNIILIPYRNRKSHLKYFLEHTVPIIQEFMPNTKVIVIEQCEGKLFNRGKILNVGFKEYSDKTKYFITNDVDINPTKLCIETYYNRYVDKEHVLGIYTSFHDTLGGVIKIRSTIFNKINGFPNNFWGWGVEDKAFQNRCEYFNIKKITSLTDNIDHPMFFKIFDDIKDKFIDKKHYEDRRVENKKKNFKKKTDKDKKKLIMSSGLNTLDYKIVKRKELHKIVELIKVDI